MCMYTYYITTPHTTAAEKSTDDNKANNDASMATKKTLTIEQARAKFEASGVPVARWAEENGFPARAVYQVLGGFTKCKHGTGHKIAVALGIKSDEEQHAA